MQREREREIDVETETEREIHTSPFLYPFACNPAAHFFTFVYISPRVTSLPVAPSIITTISFSSSEIPPKTRSVRGRLSGMETSGKGDLNI